MVENLISPLALLGSNGAGDKMVLARIKTSLNCGFNSVANAEQIKDFPCLINNGSASASEIVAGALKDHKRAVLVGESTYGKGSVQSIIPLKNEGAIRLTISKYYLPSGKSISEVGVAPDISIEEEESDFRIDTETDNQLNFARKLLAG